MGCEDGVNTDEAGVVMPGTGVLGEVAEEEEDLEGAVESKSRWESRVVSIDLREWTVERRFREWSLFDLDCNVPVD